MTTQPDPCRPDSTWLPQRSAGRRGTMLPPVVLLAFAGAVLACRAQVREPAPSAPSAAAVYGPGAVDRPALVIGEYEFHHRVLANGLQALAARDPGSEDVSIFVVYAVGKRMEGPLTTGLAHLVEHAMYAGSKLLGPGEHDRVVGELGGESNAYTRQDHTVYYDHGLAPGSLERVLAMEADRMRNLSFEPDGFLHERYRLDQEEAHTHGEDQRRAELVESVLFRAHPYGAGVLDAEGRTRGPRLTVEDARAFYDAWYHPDRAAVVVAGAIEPDEALDAVEAAFGDLPPGPPAAAFPPEPPGGLGGEARFRSSLAQDRLVWSWVGPALRGDGDPVDRIALHVLAAALGRRPAPDGSPVDASMGGGVDPDVFQVGATGVAAEETLHATLAEVRAGSAVLGEEIVLALDEERDAFRSLGLQDTRPYFSLGAAVGAFAALGVPQYPRLYEDVVASLDPERVYAAARRWLDPERRWSIRFLGTGEEPGDLPDDEEELWKVAVDAADGGETSRAIEAYEKLLTLEPNPMRTVIYLYSLGELRMRTGDLAGAERDLERAQDVVDYPAVRELLEDVKRRLASKEPAEVDSASEAPDAPVEEEEGVPPPPEPRLAASGFRVTGVEGEAPTFAAEANSVMAELEQWRGLPFLADLVIEFVGREEADDEKLAGWYEPSTGRLVVVEGQSDRFGRGTMLHEMFHALQDQHFDLGDLHGQVRGTDAERALDALIEGEAMLAVSELMDYDFEQHTAIPPAGELDEARFGKIFHYGSGLRFVRALREAGGWAQVDEVLSNPPRSTMEILHPDRYLAGLLPVDGASLASLIRAVGVDAAWTGPELEQEAVSLGEYELLLFLSRSEDTRAEAGRIAGKLAGDLRWPLGTADGDSEVWALCFHDRIGADAFEGAVGSSAEVLTPRPTELLVLVRWPAGH